VLLLVANESGEKSADNGHPAAAAVVVGDTHLPAGL